MLEPRILKLLEVDHTKYVKLCDVERLLHDMRREIYDNAECEGVTEDGLKKYKLTDTEREVLNHLYFVSSCIKRQLVLGCESPEEIKKLHERIRRGYYDGKYYLSETECDENGNAKSIIYFRKYCPGAMEARLKKEGKSEKEISEIMEYENGDPAFTADDRYAFLFESMEDAESNRVYLNHNCKLNLDIHPAFLLDKKMREDVLKGLLGEIEEGEKEDGD